MPGCPSACHNSLWCTCDIIVIPTNLFAFLSVGLFREIVFQISFINYWLYLICMCITELTYPYYHKLVMVKCDQTDRVDMVNELLLAGL